MEQERNKVYIIPKNYEDSFITASGKSFRNVIEGVVLAVIAIMIFAFLPIPLRIKIILMVIFGGGSFLIGFLGVKNYSLSEYLIIFLKFKTTNQMYDCPPKTMFESSKNNIEQDKSKKHVKSFEEDKKAKKKGENNA